LGHEGGSNVKENKRRAALSIKGSIMQEQNRQKGVMQENGFRDP